MKLEKLSNRCQRGRSRSRTRCARTGPWKKCSAPLIEPSLSPGGLLQPLVVGEQLSHSNWSRMHVYRTCSRHFKNWCGGAFGRDQAASAGVRHLAWQDAYRAAPLTSIQPESQRPGLRQMAGPGKSVLHLHRLTAYSTEQSTMLHGNVMTRNAIAHERQIRETCRQERRKHPP
jgi:hypothetical protein